MATRKDRGAPGERLTKPFRWSVNDHLMNDRRGDIEVSLRVDSAGGRPFIFV